MVFGEKYVKEFGFFFGFILGNIVEDVKVDEIFEGWKSKTTGINNFDDLPDLAKKYINRISVLTNTKIDLVSTSPRREDTILINELFS